METLKQETREKMQKAFESLLHQYSKVRTGRASASVLDDIHINYYGQPQAVKQLANISIPEARLIVIQPWDKTTLADIEKPSWLPTWASLRKTTAMSSACLSSLLQKRNARTS